MLIWQSVSPIFFYLFYFIFLNPSHIDDLTGFQSLFKKCSLFCHYLFPIVMNKIHSFLSKCLFGIIILIFFCLWLVFKWIEIWCVCSSKQQFFFSVLLFFGFACETKLDHGTQRTDIFVWCFRCESPKMYNFFLYWVESVCCHLCVLFVFTYT